MSRSQMVNFRLREEDVPRLDAAAKQAGKSLIEFWPVMLNCLVQSPRAATHKR